MGGVGSSLGAMAPIAQAALSSTIAQGVSMVVGLQKKFDWRGVAVSAAGAAVGGSSAAPNTFEGFAGNVASGLLRGAVSAAIYDKKPQWSMIAANSFGSALGDAIVGNIAQVERNRAQAKQDALNAQWFTLDPAGLGPDTPTLADLYPSFNPDAEPVGTSETNWYKQQDQLNLGELVERKSINELIKETRDLIKVISDHGAVGQPTRGVNSGDESSSWSHGSAQQEFRRLELEAQKATQVDAAEQFIEQAQAGAQATYSQWRDDAVASGSPAQYVGATFLELASDVGYDFARTGIGLYNLATSSQARSRAVQTAGYVVTNPGVVVNAAVNGVRDFLNKPFNEQAQSLFKEGLNTLAGAGIAKLAMAPVGLVGNAATRESQLQLLTSHPEAHAISAHGGSVTPEKLMNRARTGIKPNGDVGPIPSLSSAFYSDDLLLHADQSIRNGGGLANAIARQPGRSAIRVTAEDVGDLGVELGYGYKPLSKKGDAIFQSGAQGPLQRLEGLRSASGFYAFNSVTGQWETVSVFPAPH